jgi:hypothetical protein
MQADAAELTTGSYCFCLTNSVHDAMRVADDEWM